jgi:hypothetical protein
MLTNVFTLCINHNTISDGKAPLVLEGLTNLFPPSKKKKAVALFKEIQVNMHIPVVSDDKY